MICKYCGAENAEDHVYCSKCGLPLPQPQEAAVAELRQAGQREIRRSGFTLASAIIGTVVFFVVANSYFDTYSHQYFTQQGEDLARSALGIQFGCVTVATVLAYIAYAAKARGLALASAIIYTIAGGLYILFTLLLAFPLHLLLPIVFGYIGYVKMKPKPVYIVIQQQTQNK